MICKNLTAHVAMTVLTVCLTIATVSLPSFPASKEPLVVNTVTPTKRYSALLEYTKVAYVLGKRNLVQKRSWLREKA